MQRRGFVVESLIETESQQKSRVCVSHTISTNNTGPLNAFYKCLEVFIS